MLTLIIIIIIICLLIISAAVWNYYAKANLSYCENNENILCPSFYCGTDKYGNPASECKDKQAYRRDKDGNIICQTYTVNPNVVDSSANYNITQPCQNDVKGCP
jgi:hypothetical protein